MLSTTELAMAALLGSRQQLMLPFGDAPLWDGAGLEQALEQEAGRPDRLTLTDNRSVLLSCRRTEGGVQLRLHRMFLHAPWSVVRAVARGLRQKRRQARLCAGCR